MLPCQNTCPGFHSGCHKACAWWKTFQDAQRAEREAKKQYLRYHNERCVQVSYQLLSLQVRRHAW